MIVDFGQSEERKIPILKTFIEAYLKPHHIAARFVVPCFIFPPIGTLIYVCIVTIRALDFLALIFWSIMLVILIFVLVRIEKEILQKDPQVHRNHLKKLARVVGIIHAYIWATCAFCIISQILGLRDLFIGVQ